MAEAYTCWSLIRDAAGGIDQAKHDFALKYEPVLRAYLGARWRRSPRIADLDDAVQEIFIECLKEGGVLQRVDRARGGGFRAFLYGVARRVALRYETGHGRKREGRLATVVVEAGIEADDVTLSGVFDQAFARCMMEEAVRRQTKQAATLGEEAMQRVELLRLRFQEAKPIREIAEDWDMDPALVHRAYARARKEFHACLIEVMEFSGAQSRADAKTRAEELLELLS